MEDSELLLTVAEVAVGFAGFAGIVGILDRRAASEDVRADRLRLRGMLVMALLVVLFSFFPFIPSRFELAETAVWRLSSFVFALAASPILFGAVRDLRKLAAVDGLVGAARVRAPLNCVLLSLVIVLLAANALGAFGPVAAVYVLCLLLAFATTGILFLATLLSLLASSRS